MYALYSKAFAKKAEDNYNKKSHKFFNNDPFKLTAKTKTADKAVEFEANVADSARDVKFTFPVDPKFGVSIKQSIDNNKKPEERDSTTLGLTYVLDQNLTIKWDIVNPQLQAEIPKSVLTGEYVTESFSVEAKVEADSKSFSSEKARSAASVNLGFASDVPAGPSGSRFGLLYTGLNKDNKDKTVTTFVHNLAAQLGVQQSDYEVALSANFKDLAAKEPATISSGVSGIFSVNANTSVFSKIVLDQDVRERNFSLGLAYSFNASTTAKLKLSTSNIENLTKDGVIEQRVVDLAITNAFDGKNQATCAVQLKNGGAPKFGVYITLE